jgi:ribonuclease Y
VWPTAMSLKMIFILLALIGLLGVGFGYFLRWIVSLGKKGSVELEVKQMLLDAKEQAKKITDEAEVQSKKAADQRLAELKEKEVGIRQSEQRLIKKEELLDNRQTDIEKEVEHIKSKIEEIKAIREKISKAEDEQRAALEKVAKLSTEDAKNELMHRIEREEDEDLVVRMRKLENTGREKIERKAQEILTTVIHRLGNSVSQDVMTSTMTIPSDEIKGKIIGKEGRNIKAFERATGVEVIIDDTPGTITLSSFDPVRRQIARIALENLIMDGRIQPAKIEEMTKKAEEEINKIIKEKGEQAAYEANVLNLDPRILAVLGRLYFRTSYGQNVLQHSVEMAHIAGMLASELGADPAVARAGALVHDIGKAVDHEVQGSHVEIGIRILQKFGASEAIIKAMRAHHEEYPYETIESVIVQVADSISGGRPGARRDSVENYIKRLQDLEAIANSFPGIEKSYAIAAGREVRVFVRPENVSDLEARDLARNIALKIEQELKYPGEIKVVVRRESRVIELAR